MTTFFLVFIKFVKFLFQMGVISSNETNADKKAFKKLIDENVWFSATLVDFDCKRLNDHFNIHSWNGNSIQFSLKENIKHMKKSLRNSNAYYGRISVAENTIIFQCLNFNNILEKIICKSEEPVTSSLPRKSKVKSGNGLSSNSFTGNVTRNLSLSLSHSSSSNNGRVLSHENIYSCTNNNHYQIIEWPMSTIRLFGHYGNLFTFNSGRLSPTGESRFTFKIKKFNAFLNKFQMEYAASRSPLENCHFFNSPTPTTNKTKNNYITQKSHSYRNIFELGATRNNEPTTVNFIRQSKCFSRSVDKFNEYQNTEMVTSVTNVLTDTRQNSTESSDMSPLSYIELDFNSPTALYTENNQNKNEWINNTDHQQHQYHQQHYQQQQQQHQPQQNDLATNYEEFNDSYSDDYLSPLSMMMDHGELPVESPTYVIISEKRTRAVEETMKIIK